MKNNSKYGFSLRNAISIILSTLIISVCTISAQAAAEPNYAQIIYNRTGWDIQAIQDVLNEDWRLGDEISLPVAEAALIGEMRPYAADFMERGVKFEALAALAAFETGHFQYVYANNVGGIVDFENEYEHYDTIREGVDDLEQLLVNAYLNEDGLWYGGGYTVLHIRKKYNQSIDWLVGYVDVRLSLQRRIDNVLVDNNVEQSGYNTGSGQPEE